MAQLSQSAALTRFDTDVLETLFCVWHGDGDRYLERYARQLQKEYQWVEAHYLEHRDWDI